MTSSIIWVLICAPVSNVRIQVCRQKVSVRRLLGINLLLAEMPEDRLAQWTQEVVSSSKVHRPWGSRDIRKSLQVIAGFETSEIPGMAKDVESRVREAQRQFPAFKDKHVLMLNMTVYPPEVQVLPVHKLEQFPGDDPIWPEIANEIRHRSDSPPKGYMFSVVKVHLGKSKFTLFSPSTALHEVDPHQKSQELLSVSPKGLVPALMLNTFDPPRALNESTVILDFLEDIAAKSTHRSLFPPSTDPYAKALVRLQSDHINRTLMPAFYRYLQAQGPEAQISAGKEFHAAIQSLVELFEHAEREVGGTGLWVEGGDLGWADVMVAPWLFRASNVLKHYRGFEMLRGTKFEAWLGRLFEHPAFKKTCSNEEVYLDSYER
ncbi:glutathione S-transferase [Suillus tomentosus]|nr:glutathione S-transferase [Suillus tomentosus]